jgi:hypothetical protein
MPEEQRQLYEWKRLREALALIKKTFGECAKKLGADNVYDVRTQNKEIKEATASIAKHVENMKRNEKEIASLPVEERRERAIRAFNLSLPLFESIYVTKALLEIASTIKDVEKTALANIRKSEKQVKDISNAK